jgi:flavodoxin
VKKVWVVMYSATTVHYEIYSVCASEAAAERLASYIRADGLSAFVVDYGVEQ